MRYGRKNATFDTEGSVIDISLGWIFPDNFPKCRVLWPPDVNELSDMHDLCCPRLTPAVYHMPSYLTSQTRAFEVGQPSVPLHVNCNMCAEPS